MKATIGILIIATGKYKQFVPNLYKSIHDYFLVEADYDIMVYIFSDTKDIDRISKMQDSLNGINMESKRLNLYYNIINREHVGFPNATLLRYHTFLEHRAVLEQEDYLYYIDADMLLVDHVTEAILPIESPNGEKCNLVTVQHPGNLRRPMFADYETNYKSTACVSGAEIAVELPIYMAGGFNGGTVEAFLRMAEVIADNVNVDNQNRVIAKWHDESHFNKYILGRNKLILDSGYCFPEEWGGFNQVERKILALKKDHAEIRSD